ncbi:hypothetical protein P4S72_08695 [Vibrio sp. PP-XX7]
MASDGWEIASSLLAMAPPLTSAERYAKQIKEWPSNESNNDEKPEEKNPFSGNGVFVLEVGNKGRRTYVSFNARQ